MQVTLDSSVPCSFQEDVAGLPFVCRHANGEHTDASTRKHYRFLPNSPQFSHLTDEDPFSHTEGMLVAFFPHRMRGG